MAVDVPRFTVTTLTGRVGGVDGGELHSIPKFGVVYTNEIKP